MKKIHLFTDDTIAAISTPPGEAGISIVRMSGKDSLEIASRIFLSKRGTDIKDSPSHKLHYGFIIDPATHMKIDEVLLSIMRRPNTYTKEDMVEINCHGGYFITRRILELLLKNGARLAEPGEFTMRAFLNGRIDLTQAEAIIDLIRADSEYSERIAIESLTGTLRKRIEDIMENLMKIVTEVEAYIDFPEEDIDIPSSEWLTKLIAIHQKIEELSDSFYEGKILKEGLKVAIAGRPNVGKSSLLNRLLEEERVIVTDIPGTTRDTIEETINIKGIHLRLIDTAGIRKAKDIIEEEGIRRSKEAIERADLILFVIDGSEPLEEGDISLLKKIKESNKRFIAVINKKDRGLVPLKDQRFEGIKRVNISALTGEGIDELKETIFEILTQGMNYRKGELPLITRVRHKDLLDQASRSIENAINGVRESLSTELLSLELRNSMESLGEITGTTITSEDILRRIFSEFCIGK